MCILYAHKQSYPLKLTAVVSFAELCNKHCQNCFTPCAVGPVIQCVSSAACVSSTFDREATTGHAETERTESLTQVSHLPLCGIFASPGIDAR